VKTDRFIHSDVMLPDHQTLWLLNPQIIDTYPRMVKCQHLGKKPYKNDRVHWAATGIY